MLANERRRRRYLYPEGAIGVVLWTRDQLNEINAWTTEQAEAEAADYHERCTEIHRECSFWWPPPNRPSGKEYREWCLEYVLGIKTWHIVICPSALQALQEV